MELKRVRLDGCLVYLTFGTVSFRPPMLKPYSALAQCRWEVVNILTVWTFIHRSSNIQKYTEIKGILIETNGVT